MALSKGKKFATAFTLAFGLTYGHYESVPGQKLEIAEEIEADYIRQFGCSVADTVFEIDYDGAVIDETEQASALAVTIDRGEVVFSLNSINQNSLNPIDRSAFRELTAHEMAHSCAGPETPLPERFVTKDAKLIATRGFLVLVELPDRPEEELAFDYIEEGVATVLGKQIHDDEIFEFSPEYQAVRDLTIDLQNEHDISNDELAEMLNNSDLLNFVARVKGLDSVDDVKVEHLGGLMWQYCTAYEAARAEYSPQKPAIDC